MNERFFKLIETIESEIDPFDLNVLSPYMQSHLQKILPRSSVSFRRKKNPTSNMNSSIEWLICSFYSDI